MTIGYKVESKIGLSPWHPGARPRIKARRRRRRHKDDDRIQNLRIKAGDEDAIGTIVLDGQSLCKQNEANSRAGVFGHSGNHDCNSSSFRLFGSVANEMTLVRS